MQAYLDRCTQHSHKSQPNWKTLRPRARHEENQLGLFVVLYGDSSLFDRVGIFITRCDLFLQHPKECDRNVPYHNPHCLPRAGGTVLYTQHLEELLVEWEMKDFELSRNPIDLFSDANKYETLPEAASPQGLQKSLYMHQRQALTFMMEREHGWALQRGRADIWRAEEDNIGRTIYLNRVTGQKYRKPPPTFCGGLLTDAPGLGKTLSIIALLVQGRSDNMRASGQVTSIPTTLLVVPKTRKFRQRQTSLLSPSKPDYSHPDLGG